MSQPVKTLEQIIRGIRRDATVHCVSEEQRDFLRAKARNIGRTDLVFKHTPRTHKPADTSRMLRAIGVLK